MTRLRSRGLLLPNQNSAAVPLHTSLAIKAGCESLTFARRCHHPAPTRCTWANSMPTPLRLPLLLLLVLWGASGASAQFDRAWLDRVLPEFKGYKKYRFTKPKLFQGVLRQWPGGGSVHHIVPLNALMECVVLISSLSTDDELNQVVSAIGAFVHAMPDLPGARVRTEMEKHYDDYIYRLELILEVRTVEYGCACSG